MLLKPWILDELLFVSPFSVREVIARFSKKLIMPKDSLWMRCNGRVLGVQEEVRALANQTVWLTVIGVKEECI